MRSYKWVDVGTYYTFKLGSENAISLAVNVNNLFDTEYIAESLTNTFADPGDTTYNGINTSNKVFFGFGRTFNVSARYAF